MNDFNNRPRPDDVLGEGFEADWQNRHSELVERAREINLAIHFTSEETDRLEDELTMLGISDTDEFLRIQIIRHADLGASDRSPEPLVYFTSHTIAGLQDGQFS